jgi:hypothetical protein
MKKTLIGKDTLSFPENEKRAKNLSSPDFSFSSSSSSAIDPTHYLKKLVSDENSIVQISLLLQKYQLTIPSSLSVFRKGCVVLSVGEKFIAFDPHIRFFTVLDYLREDIKTVQVPPTIRSKITDFLTELNKILFPHKK